MSIKIRFKLKKESEMLVIEGKFDVVLIKMDVKMDDLLKVKVE